MNRAKNQHRNISYADSEFESLFDGTRSSLKSWHQVGPDLVTVADERVVTSAVNEFGLVFYTCATFGDFILRMEYSLEDPCVDNSGIFVRFRNSRLPPTQEILAKNRFLDSVRNKAWIAPYSKFEIQID